MQIQGTGETTFFTIYILECIIQNHACTYQIFDTFFLARSTRPDTNRYLHEWFGASLSAVHINSDSINKMHCERILQTCNREPELILFMVRNECVNYIVLIRTIPLQLLPQGKKWPTNAHFFLCCCVGNEKFKRRTERNSHTRLIQRWNRERTDSLPNSHIHFGTLWILYFHFFFFLFRLLFIIMIYRKEALFSVSANNQSSNIQLIPTIYIAF